MNDVNTLIDLSNLYDLPDIMAAQVKKPSSVSLYEKVIGLFEATSLDSLSVDQIMVGLFRQHGDKYDRKLLLAKLQNLKRKKGTRIARDHVRNAPFHIKKIGD